MRESAPARSSVAQRLERDGIRLGDRVATLAWNTGRHLEAWYGIMGIGAVCHTLNPRLFPEQLAWIINHAEDRVIFDRPDLRCRCSRSSPTSCRAIEHIIVLTDAAHMPATTPAQRASPTRSWSPRSTATSSGALRREHRRGPLLHLRHHRQSQGRALFAPLQRPAHLDGAAAGRHGPRRAATWCCRSCRCSTPTAGASPSPRRWSGAKLVMPGAEARRRLGLRAARDEKVTFTAAVPTVWLMLLQHLREPTAASSRT